MRPLEGQCKYSTIMFWMLLMEQILLQLHILCMEPKSNGWRFSIWNSAGFLPSRVCCPKMGTQIPCLPVFSLATSFVRSGPRPQFLMFRLFGGHFSSSHLCSSIFLPSLSWEVLKETRLIDVYHVYHPWHFTFYYLMLQKSPVMIKNHPAFFQRIQGSQVVCRVDFQVQFQAKSLAERCTQKDTSYGAWSQFLFKKMGEPFTFEQIYCKCTCMLGSTTIAWMLRDIQIKETYIFWIYFRILWKYIVLVMYVQDTEP